MQNYIFDKQLLEVLYLCYWTQIMLISTL